MSSHADAEPRDGDDSEDRRDFGDSGDPRDIADVGLLNPVSAGSAAEPLTSDHAVVTAMVSAEAALLRALVETGIAPESALSTAAVLESARPDPRRLALAASTGGNPVIPLVAELREHVGVEHAAWVHHGATSQDILDTALMLVGGQAARCVADDLTRLAATLATLADETRALPVVGRTLTQQALPTTFGMRAAGWLAGVLDALDAVRSCLPLPVSLAGPVGTASVYAERGPAVLEAFARSLGQAAPISPWHTRRTPVLRFGAALVEAGAACGKIAADVLVLAQSEVGELREATAGPSSAMAHKANPAQAVLVAAAVRQLPALSAVLAGCAVAEQERPAGAWHAEWQTMRTLVRLVAGAVERTADVTATLRLDREAMRRNLDQLVGAVEEDQDWVVSRTAHVDVWIDRVLVRYEEVVR